MFERFAATARAVVTRAGESAITDAAPEIGTGRLLLALTADDGPAGAALAATGVTDAAVTRQLRSGAETALDTEALADLGIDVERIRRAAEETFGVGALEAAGDGRRARRRRARGGAARFSRAAVTTLERALRAAASAGSHELRSEHLLLGLLAAEDAQLGRILAGCGTSRPAVRAALDQELRRSA